VDLTSDEVAALLRVNLTTIHRLARSGKIPAYKLGRDWRFTRDAIDKSTESYKPIDQ
jgi:excisionase family DNA binding protein